jgi:glycosyltransferase involved in cell wall biosynthesis
MGQDHQAAGGVFRFGAPRIAVVLKGYPRLSETFIAQELLALECRGLGLRLYSLRRPTDPAVHPVHREIAAPVTYLPEYLKDDPGRVWRAWRIARGLPGYAAARRAFRRDFLRDRSANRLRRFGQACVLATELPPEITHIYAHFLHTPASVARYAAIMRALPWSASAHAKDIWTTPAWEKREKLADAAWVVTCTASGRDHLAALAPEPDRLSLVYHGLDFSRFGPPPTRAADRDGSDAARAVHLLCVGRLVEKKGTADLLEALARLPRDLHWRLIHIGGGELRAVLKRQAERLGLADRIEWLGAQPQERVLAEYRRADLFVLASRIAADGDRDGLPNVLMEAQSQGLACLATRVAAIPELIEDGVTGSLAEPGDLADLARALERMLRDPIERARLGAAGAKRVRERFAMNGGIDALVARLAPDLAPDLALGMAPPIAAAE